MPKIKYIVVKLEDNALKNVGNIKFLLVFTFDVALSFIQSLELLLVSTITQNVKIISWNLWTPNKQSITCSLPSGGECWPSWKMLNTRGLNFYWILRISLYFKPQTFLITAMCYKDTDWHQSQLPREADCYKNQTDGFSSGNNLSVTLVYLSSQKRAIFY